MDHERAEQPWTIGRAILLVRRWPVRFAAPLLLALVGGVLWIGTQEPVYRAQATLLLEAATPPPSSRMALGAAMGVDLSTEIAVMRSREVLAATVSEPDAIAGVENYARLGLTTLVDDIAARPIPATLRKLCGAPPPTGALRATGGSGLRVASVEFLTESRARIAVPSRFGRISDAVLVDVVPGEVVPLPDGGELTLWPEGDLTGRTFHITSRSPSEAVAALRERVDVEREGRATRIVQLGVRDSNPERAAQIANALAANYLEITRLRTQRQSSGTTRFIEEQLATEQAALEEAAKALAAVQGELPDASVPQASTAALLAQVRQLEQERMRLAIAERSFRETQELLNDGAPDAIARLDPTFLDAVSQRYVSQLGELNAEATVQDRTTPSSYRYVLRSRVTEFEDQAQDLQAELSLIQGVIQRFEAGDHSALTSAQSGNSLRRPTDSMTSVLLNELSRLQGVRDEKLAVYTDKHPDVIEAVASVAAIEQRVLSHLKDRATNDQDALTRLNDLADDRRRLLETQPGKEREAIASASAAMRELTRNHLRGRLAVVGAERDRVDAEIERVSADLARLPEDAQRVAVPMRQVEVRQATIQLLMRSLTDARMMAGSPTKTSEIVDPAMPPNSRQRPSVMLALMIAAVIGALLGLWYAAWVEREQGHIRTPEELEEASGLPCLAVLQGSAFEGLLGGAGHAEDDTAFRFLRTSLLAASSTTHRGDIGRVVMVTSFHTDDGRGHAVTGLARASAAAGDHTLVVDLDGAAPFFAERDGYAANQGEMERILANPSSWRSALQRTPLLDADLLLWSGISSNALGAPSLEHLLALFPRDYDRVIVKLPPIGTTPEAGLLLGRADSALLVARVGVTMRRHVRRAADHLHTATNGVSGVILMTRPTSRAQRTTPRYPEPEHVPA